TKSISNTLISDGTQIVSFSGSVTARIDIVDVQDQSEAYVDWTLGVDGYYWDHANRVWDNSQGVITNTQIIPFDQSIQPENRNLYKGGFDNITTEQVPAAAD